MYIPKDARLSLMETKDIFLPSPILLTVFLSFNNSFLEPLLCLR